MQSHENEPSPSTVVQKEVLVVSENKEEEYQEKAKDKDEKEIVQGDEVEDDDEEEEEDDEYSDSDEEDSEEDSDDDSGVIQCEDCGGWLCKRCGGPCGEDEDGSYYHRHDDEEQDEEHEVLIADVKTPWNIPYDYDEDTTIQHLIDYLVEAKIYERGSIQKITIHLGLKQITDFTVSLSSLQLAPKDHIYVEGNLVKKQVKRYMTHLRDHDHSHHPKDLHHHQKVRDAAKVFRTIKQKNREEKRLSTPSELRRRIKKEERQKKHKAKKEQAKNRIKQDRERLQQRPHLIVESNEQLRKEIAEREAKRLQTDFQIQSQLLLSKGPKQKTRKSKKTKLQKNQTCSHQQQQQEKHVHLIGSYRFHLIKQNSVGVRVWASVNQCSVPEVKNYEKLLRRGSHKSHSCSRVKKLKYPGLAPHIIYEISHPSTDYRPYGLLFSLTSRFVPKSLEKQNILPVMKRIFNERNDRFIVFENYSTHTHLTKDVALFVTNLQKC